MSKKTAKAMTDADYAGKVVGYAQSLNEAIREAEDNGLVVKLDTENGIDYFSDFSSNPRVTVKVSRIYGEVD